MPSPVKEIPNKFTGPLITLTPRDLAKAGILSKKGPNSKRLVFSKLIDKPDAYFKSFKIFRASSTEFLVPSRKRVVSSTYCIILTSQLLTVIPLMELVC